MRLLDRYLFRELFAPLAFCLIGIQAFVMVFIVFSDAHKIQEQKLHFGDVVLYAVASSADFIWVVLPISLLVALLITQTELARHNEITAMRAAGGSLWRICAPYFLVGLAASGALFALNELLVPRCAQWTDRILHRYVAEPAGRGTTHEYFNAPARRTWVYAEFDAKTAAMIAPSVGWYLPDGSYRDVTAERAAYTNGVWTFFSKVIENEQTNSTADPVRILWTNVLALPQFKETPKDIERDMRFDKYYSNLNSKKLNIPLGLLWEYLQTHPQLPSKEAGNFWTKFDGRLALPWTCLVVVFIAIPFGAASGRRNMFFGVAGSVFVCFVFFVVQQFSLVLGLGGYLPPWLAAWLPNLLFAAAGLALMARVR